MAEPIWNRFLTERDKAVFAAAGYGARAGFGNRPALLVIDVNYNFCGDRRELRWFAPVPARICACGSSGAAGCRAGGVMAWERRRGEGAREGGGADADSA